MLVTVTSPLPPVSLPDAGDGAGPAVASVPQAVQEYEAGRVFASGGHHHGVRHLVSAGSLGTLATHTQSDTSDVSTHL